MEKIGQGRYQEVFKNQEIISKIASTPLSTNEINRMVDYYQEVKSSDIKVPEFLGITENNNKQLINWSYEGSPLEKFIENSQSKEVLKVIDGVISESLKAYRHQIAFYPILEQFTVSNNEPVFVDFYPSRTAQDFANYGEKKREALGLMFFGLTPKVTVPLMQTILLRPDLKLDIKNHLPDLLSHNHLSNYLYDIEKIMDFDQIIPRNQSPYVAISKTSITFYNTAQEVSPESEFVVLNPSQNIWTYKLFHQDLTKISQINKNA